MENEKYYFIVDVEGHLKGYTKTKFKNNEGNLLSEYLEVENPSQDLIDNFIMYKVVDGVPVKMSDEEFKALYPNYGAEPQPSETEILGQRITDTELDAMESNQRITDLELFMLEGGASNV